MILLCPFVKVFADIEDFHQLNNKLFSRASYEGSTFLEMEVLKKRRFSPDEVAAVTQDMKPGGYNWFGWRYIPNIGKPGAALSHATLFPQALRFTEVYMAEGRVCWKELTFEENPTQAHIINALSQLPVEK